MKPKPLWQNIDFLVMKFKDLCLMHRSPASGSIFPH